LVRTIAIGCWERGKTGALILPDCDAGPVNQNRRSNGCLSRNALPAGETAAGHGMLPRPCRVVNGDTAAKRRTPPGAPRFLEVMISRGCGPLRTRRRNTAGGGCRSSTRWQMPAVTFKKKPPLGDDIESGGKSVNASPDRMKVGEFRSSMATHCSAEWSHRLAYRIGFFGN
jgi:hypothetical protein